MSSSNKYWIAFQSFPGLGVSSRARLPGFEGMTAYDLWETYVWESFKRIY
jgi:hypothetical protein